MAETKAQNDLNKENNFFNNESDTAARRLARKRVKKLGTLIVKRKNKINDDLKIFEYATFLAILLSKNRLLDLEIYI